MKQKTLQNFPRKISNNFNSIIYSQKVIPKFTLLSNLWEQMTIGWIIKSYLRR